MSNYVLVFLFTLFAVWLIVDAVRIFHNRRRKPESAPAAKELPSHSHSWRKITPFAKQCKDKDCKTIEVAPTAPEGLEEYLKLMASAKNPRETLLHAEEYRFHDYREHGWTCPSCKRVIPKLSELPRSPFPVNGEILPPVCPYCNVSLDPPELPFSTEQIANAILRRFPE